MPVATAYVFPGQGSQFVGMGRALYANSVTARDVFAQADAILGFPLSELCFDGPAEALNDTVNTQPALLATSVALLRYVEERGGEGAACVAGHSVGEFSALVAAQALAFEDGLKLVRERGRLMKEAGERRPGGMAAVMGLELSAVESLCARVREESSDHVGVANDNCPGQVVISGAKEPLERAMALAAEQGAKRVVPLAVSIAAHSPLMADAAAEFRRSLAGIPLRSPAVPFVANTTADALNDAEAIREALGRQLTSPVRWSESVRWMVEQGVRRFVEVGPKDVLTGLGRRIDRTVEHLHSEVWLGGA